MPRIDESFKQRVYELVAKIPRGQCMTYGQIAAICGAAWAAWEVGQIAHSGPDNLPWQRVVNKQGGLARGYPGGQEAHKKALMTEGVAVNEDYQVDLEELLWQPNIVDSSL